MFTLGRRCLRVLQQTKVVYFILFEEKQDINKNDTERIVLKKISRNPLDAVIALRLNFLLFPPVFTNVICFIF